MTKSSAVITNFPTPTRPKLSSPNAPESPLYRQLHRHKHFIQLTLLVVWLSWVFWMCWFGAFHYSNAVALPSGESQKRPSLRFRQQSQQSHSHHSLDLESVDNVAFERLSRYVIEERRRDGVFDADDMAADEDEVDGESEDGAGYGNGKVSEEANVIEDISGASTDDGDSGSGDSNDENFEDTESETEENIAQDYDRKGKTGRIAWLMSYPNSGTSYTSKLVRHASNYTTASNYGMECFPGLDGMTVPVYEWSKNGPCWIHPPIPTSNSIANDINGSKVASKIKTKFEFGIPPATSSILTKTHCGGRCVQCRPESYLETTKSFLKQCFSGSRSVPYNPNDSNVKVNPKLINGDRMKVYTTDSPQVLNKAVHLIRNPFDNLVSRFHHEQKEHAKRVKTSDKYVKWMNRYPNNANGFRKWCADDDSNFLSEEVNVDWEEYGYYSNIPGIFESVQCHGEFFRYAQWHRRAMEAVRELDIPVHYVYYEDYKHDLKGQTVELLKFLDLPFVRDLPKFDSNKDYSDYFTVEERASATELMKRVLGSEENQKMFERYWVTFDFEKLKLDTKLQT